MYTKYGRTQLVYTQFIFFMPLFKPILCVCEYQGNFKDNILFNINQQKRDMYVCI